jgi:hypothetical protein
MHRLTTTFVLGYHGCDASVAERLVAGTKFKTSANPYDWLGVGIYFWEANPRRGLEFAHEVMHRKGLKTTIKEPAVVGAVIDLRLCLDLSTSAGTQEIRHAYESFAAAVEVAGQPMPRNRGGPDLLLRDHDRAVLEHLHATRKHADLPEIDTVRGFYFEGERLYPDAGFFEKTHVQICVRKPECIHGVFRVPASDLS